MTFFILCCVKLSFNVTFFPSRITDNLLAMARPSTEIIEKYSIIEQFRRCSSLCLPHIKPLTELKAICFYVSICDVFPPLLRRGAATVSRCGLKTIINLQRPGEHASCGNPLEQESGFTYRPETFMEADSEFLYFPGMNSRPLVRKRIMKKKYEERGFFFQLSISNLKLRFCE